MRAAVGDAATVDGPFAARDPDARRQPRLGSGATTAAAAALAATLVRAARGTAARERVGVRLGPARPLPARARRTGRRRTTPSWPLLADLGSYDVRSGWALWVATPPRREQAGAAARAAPRANSASRSPSGGEAWLTAAQLRAAGFPADVEAALGALVLPREDLADHFARHATPPADGLLQGYWLRGQRRRQPLDGAWYEKLAATPGLKDGHRLDTWRGASEARVLAGEWEPGLRDLDAGLRLDGRRRLEGHAPQAARLDREVSSCSPSPGAATPMRSGCWRARVVTCAARTSRSSPGKPRPG